MGTFPGKFGLKECIVCGKQFSPNSGRQKVCPDCQDGYYSKYYVRYYQEHKERYAELRLKSYHKARVKKKAIPIECEGYAERQKAETIEKYARVKVE